MMKNIPILLLATERSGTNLLRAIMSSHSRIASPSPFSMVDGMAGSIYKYFGNAGNHHFNELIEDAIKLTQSHLNPWPMEFSPEAVKQKAEVQSFWEVFRALNELYTESEQKQHWFSKEPGLFHHIYELALHMPDAKFVYMVRDPRDVAASMVQGGVHEQNVYNAARRWRDEQRICLNASRDPLLQDRLFVMNYEALLDDSEGLVRRLMDFLALDFEPRQLEFYKDEKVVAHAEKSQFWQNLSKPIDRGNKGRYKSKLTGQQLKVIESLCWDEMKAHGYAPESEGPAKIHAYQRIYYRAHGLIKKVMQERGFSAEARKHRKRRQASSAIGNRRFD
ncbi:MAG: sulfotransferase [Methylomicrobium sp.]|nr:sulfotransferase [Methylomicrobium sp.]